MLFFSWFSERDRILERISGSLHTLIRTLDVDHPSAQLEQLIASSKKTEQYPVIGYVYINDENIVAQSGNITNLVFSNPELVSGVFDRQSGYYDSRLVLSPEGETERKQLWLRVNASYLNEYLGNYVLRIVGLVILVSLFVTFGCLLILTPLLIRPLQKLNRLMIQGQEHGIRNIDLNTVEAQRRDELGSVFRSFNRLKFELTDSEDARSRNAQRFEDFANMGADCFWEIDQRFHLVFIAGDVKRVFCLDEQPLTGQCVLSSQFDISRRFGNFKKVLTSLKTTGEWEGLVVPIKKEGNPVAVKIISKAIVDRAGVFRGARGTIVDITIASELQKELKYQASHDELTGLYNRREFNRHVKRESSRYIENGETFSFMVLDLDRFKHVNDTCGHAAGDLLLKSISKLIASCVSSIDSVARMGGDEFTILLPDKGAVEAVEVAQRIVEAVSSYRFHWDDDIYFVTVSIGVAQVSPELESPEALLFAADSCCMSAKAAGKNRAQLYNSVDLLVSRKPSDTYWVKKLTQALDNNKLTLFRQNIVQIQLANDEEHFEVLVRMRDDEGGFHPPASFLPIAEQYGMMPRVDRWVVSESARWLKRQEFSADTKLCMNVNLSVISLTDHSFKTFLLEEIKQLGPLARYLCLEVTESAAMMNFEQIVSLLDEIRGMGCLVALDDFGTGFSSLAHIKELPLDYIKIDGVFIKEIRLNELDRALVRSVSEIAQLLGIKTVAEFVDNEETLQLLKELKIDYAQGFLFSKPVELHDLCTNTGKDIKRAA